MPFDKTSYDEQKHLFETENIISLPEVTHEKKALLEADIENQ